MEKNFYNFPKSSFLGMGKDTALIVNKILNNKRLLKLLYYVTPLTKEQEQKELTSDQIKSLFDNKQISNIPKIVIHDKQMNYLRITYDSFTPNTKNPYYRDHIVELKIICPFSSWDLENYELRPYRIAGELDSMLNDTRLTGIGKLTFLGADADVYDDYYGGVTLRYLAVRGDEDKDPKQALVNL